MQYRRLGDAGVKLSEIGLGGWLTFGNAVEQERARNIFAAAFDAGINFFDTADAYARGECEAAWGELLHGRRRQDYVLATKLFFPISENINDRGLSRKHIFESIHNSLRRLKTDYVDLYQCHRFDPETPLEETVRAMDDPHGKGAVLGLFRMVGREHPAVPARVRFDVLPPERKPAGVQPAGAAGGA